MLLNRVTWGANASSARQMAATSTERWLERQLRPPQGDDLPAEAKAQVAAMTITQKLDARARELRPPSAGASSAA